MRNGLVDAEFKRQHRSAHQVYVLAQRRTVKGQRARVILTLVARKFWPHPNNAVLAAVCAGVLR